MKAIFAASLLVVRQRAAERAVAPAPPLFWPGAQCRATVPGDSAR